uniref:D-isomer specific 2-hydroxyacid dehydrogenase NAD-binding domain-containing protein n=1 Tax=Ananas comosus var. bracteatus TaxID=296719 RepID=A0A6V7QKW8_ANACO|nr:unnamed protein product [Ananas comosus var. bracteatus]
MQGEIKGAGLDVFENEPSVPNELFTMDNVVLSPHLAAFTTESSSDLLELIIANFEAFFSNKPLITPVSIGKRVGIVGLGSIGSEIVKRLDAFGCTIMYNSRSKKPSVPYKYFPNTHDLAVESDILILSCALTPQTHHVINRDVLLALHRDSVIINVECRALVDEKELVKCLVEGMLGAAGLDVVEKEPAAPKELF